MARTGPHSSRPRMLRQRWGTRRPGPQQRRRPVAQGGRRQPRGADRRDAERKNVRSKRRVARRKGELSGNRRRAGGGMAGDTKPAMLRCGKAGFSGCRGTHPGHRAVAAQVNRLHAAARGLPDALTTHACEPRARCRAGGAVRAGPPASGRRQQRRQEGQYEQCRQSRSHVRKNVRWRSASSNPRLSGKRAPALHNRHLAVPIDTPAGR
jgi:hypothetical protein